MNVSDILMNNRMSSRAAYYSGRGATTSDLTSEILLGIQKDLKKHHGEQASESLVKMVQSMKNMNATDFINNLYSLERSGFVWTVGEVDENGFDFEKDEDGEYNAVHGMASVFSAMSRGNRDETQRIKGGFLWKNGGKPQHRVIGDGHSYVEVW